MHTEIDITDDDPSYGSGRGNMPEPAVIEDNGDILFHFGEVTLRMTYAQFDRILDKAQEWRGAVPAADECDLNTPWE